MLHKWTRRTPVRLALSFALLFSVLVSIVIGALYWRMSADFEARNRVRVEEARDALVAIDAEKGFDALAAVVANESASVRDASGIFLLRDATGKIVAGNVTAAPPFAGWRSLPRSELRPLGDGGELTDVFLSTWNPVSRGMVLVGVSDGDARAARRLLVEGLGAAIVAMTATGTLAALLLARRTQFQIDAISQTLADVADGRIKQRIALIRDNSDLDQVAVQINGTLDRLEGLIDGVKQVSTDIAHDLKTPIGRLRRRLEEAGQTADDAARVRDAIANAIAEADAIVGTFEALLRIADIEGGARRAKFVAVDFARLLDDLADVYRPVAEDAGHKLEWARPLARPVLIRGDRELLMQLFSNIIENAIRHSPAPMQIDLSLAADARGVAVSVADGGPGIAQSEHDKVFRRLYRVEKSRTTPGSGLGLALVAAIADLHHADLTLGDNKPGLIVTITFPSRPCVAA